MQLSPLRLTVIAAVLVAAGTVAGSAWTRGDRVSTGYVCDGGERFSVDYYAHHVRVRTGTGIVALPASVDDAGTRYSDGETQFRLDDDTATLLRPGLPPASGCHAQRQRS